MTTSFFRGGSYLPMALRKAMERTGEPTALSVVSVACSNGAEVDSLLALHNNRGKSNGHRGKVVIAGYDINSLALEDARRGLYTLRKPDLSPNLQPQQEQALKGLGFYVSYEPPISYVPGVRAGAGVSSSNLKADAIPVREGHAVMFTEHDATEPLPVREPVDLALANNLLYHLSSDTAARIVRNMADVLADRGVLSFGGSSLSKDSPVEAEQVVRLLDEEFSLQPLFRDSTGTPVMFSRA
jgi:chemotaxis methyl-accepting protein methylase